jgi:hypothetical protein
MNRTLCSSYCTNVAFLSIFPTVWGVALASSDSSVESIHRGLKLDGAIGQGKIYNSLKSEKFSKSFLSHIGKNKIKF